MDLDASSSDTACATDKVLFCDRTSLDWQRRHDKALEAFLEEALPPFIGRVDI